MGRPSLNDLPANDSAPAIIQLSYSTHANTTAREKFLPAPIWAAAAAIDLAAVVAQKEEFAPAGNLSASPSKTARMPPLILRQSSHKRKNLRPLEIYQH